MGYSNALSFRNINDVKLRDVETFVQHDLMKMIQRKYERGGSTFEDADKIHFFGIYDCDHEKFQFSDYDKELITKLVQFVRISYENFGPKYFVKIGEGNVTWSNEWFFKSPVPHSSTNQEISLNNTTTFTHRILQKFLDTANKNAKTSAGGYRFDEELKSYASYLRMIAGPLAYQTIQKNLPLALPSISGTNRFIRRSHHNIVEGVLRSDELFAFLNERNLPLAVSLSEDSTRAVNRIQYDSGTNQLVGFVLPRNENGLPIPFAFKARTAAEIVEHFSRDIPVSHFFTTIMATPLGDAPSFCLSIFGCNGKFTAFEVTKRWTFITAELKKLGITTVSIASDSDPRYNSSMRRLSGLGEISNAIENNDWFFAGNNLNPPFYFQDIIHILTKLRNFFLKTKGKGAKKLPFGNSYIQSAHLQYLLDHVGRDKHLLTSTTLNPVDRQNFASVEKICDQKVIDLLRQRTKNSQATVKFLEILRDVKDAFMAEKLSPEDRIKKMWYCIFLIRIWRQYIVKRKCSTLKDNFLTSNCYICLELNAHSLIRSISFLNRTNQPHLFMPTEFNSQPCEKFYRQIRSFTTVYSTVVNCTMKEALGRVQKIQLQTQISASDSQFIFPRSLSSNVSTKVNTFRLPTDIEMFDIIEGCKNRAIDDAIIFGLLKQKISEVPCKIGPPQTKDTASIQRQFAAMAISNKISRKICLEDIELKNYEFKFSGKEVNKNGPYVEIIANQKRFIVKKTSLCWLLSKDPVKLSSDRLERVKDSYARNNVKKVTATQRIKLTRKYQQKRKIHLFKKY